MGFDPNRPYKANKYDYINIVFCLILAMLAIYWALN